MSAIIATYFLCALLLTLYGVNTHILIQLFKRSSRCVEADKKYLAEFYHPNPACTLTAGLEDLLPVVTTQLPVYNELNVVERLIDAVAAFQYPHGKHEIQVLDDSTDEGRHLVAEKVKRLRQKGIQIHHITRTHRQGFKAGALRNGLVSAKGEFIAIFDADFIPQPDFLLRAVPFFQAEQRLALVQARWGHTNENESWVTRLQAVGINGHFMVEQAARSASKLFMNFNGTAGIIRKEAIIDAGNWQGDTLTEDMDLSYRLQLCGWRCRFLADLIAPAEIPSDLNGFKNQQFRWAKGSTQTAIKLIPRILRSSAVSFAKFQAVMHMTHYLIHPMMLTVAILAPFLLLQKTSFMSGVLPLLFGLLLLISCTGPSRMYLVAEKSLGRTYWKTLLFLPLMVCMGCGLALNNSRAVFEAIVGKTSEFVRTPKKGKNSRKMYTAPKSPLILLEILIGLWCLFGVTLYFNFQHYLIGHFMLIYAIGFLSIGIVSWRHAVKKVSG
ncbi:MAG: glycosyltransferase [Desulforhopalus sp.]